MGGAGSKQFEAHVTDRKTTIKNFILQRRNWLAERPIILDGVLSPPVGKGGLPFLDPVVLPILIKFLFGGSLLKCFEVSLEERKKVS
jgi:hypothetical protein